MAGDSPAIPPNRSALLHVLLNRQSKQRSPAPAPAATGDSGGEGAQQAVREETASDKVLLRERRLREEFLPASSSALVHRRDSSALTNAGSASHKTEGRGERERKSSVPEAAFKNRSSDPVSQSGGSGSGKSGKKKKKKSVSDLIARFEGGSGNQAFL